MPSTRGMFVRSGIAKALNCCMAVMEFQLSYLGIVKGPMTFGASHADAEALLMETAENVACVYLYQPIINDKT